MTLDQTIHPCCTTWNNNPQVSATAHFAIRADGYPVTSGHLLIIPNRHIDRLADLSPDEAADLLKAVQVAQQAQPAPAYTVAVNDGEEAGRTVPHLHIHVIPRREGDVPDPRGGVRQLFHPPDQDPWLNRP